MTRRYWSRLAWLARLLAAILAVSLLLAVLAAAIHAR